MGPLLHALENPNPGLIDFSLGSIAATLLMAFVLGQLISWVYSGSHSGLSYSVSFTQSLMLMTIIVSLVMRVIGNSIITAFGLLGALALIRFRNVLKDTRDTVFVFIALVVGMSVGSQRYLTAIAGTVAMVLVILYHNWTSFGVLSRYDGYLTWRSSKTGDGEGPTSDCSSADTDLWELLDRFCSTTELISTRQSGDDEGSEYVYQVGLRDRNRSEELVDEVRKITGIRHVSFVMRGELSEI